MSFCRCEKALGMLMVLSKVKLCCEATTEPDSTAWNPCTFIHHLNCKTICIGLESALVHLVLPDTLIKNASFKL